MSSPSISVMKFGSAFRRASTLRQSYSVAQYRASACIVASCTPCDASVTVSRSGHCVALMRLRRSIRASSGTLTRNGRIAVLPSWVIMSSLLPIDDTRRTTPNPSDEGVVDTFVSMLGQFAEHPGERHFGVARLEASLHCGLHEAPIAGVAHAFEEQRRV